VHAEEKLTAFVELESASTSSSPTPTLAECYKVAALDAANKLSA
jgi:hypothetical protein